MGSLNKVVLLSVARGKVFILLFSNNLVPYNEPSCYTVINLFKPVLLLLGNFLIPSIEKASQSQCNLIILIFQNLYVVHALRPNLRHKDKYIRSCMTNS